LDINFDLLFGPIALLEAPTDGTGESTATSTLTNK